MKTLIVLLLIAGPAVSQTFTDSVRLINNQRVELLPLMTWWTNVAAIQKQNERTNIKKPKRPVPPRPLTQWVRVTTERMTNAGLVWIAEVQLQERPDAKPVKELAVIRHAPLNQKQQFDSAVVAEKQAASRAESAQAHAEYQSAVAAENARYGATYRELSNLEPGNHTFRTAADSRSVAANNAHQAAEQSANRAAAARREQARNSAITHGRTQFALDTFVLRTGEVYNGLPVYDTGFVFGR